MDLHRDLAGQLQEGGDSETISGFMQIVRQEGAGNWEAEMFPMRKKHEFQSRCLL